MNCITLPTITITIAALAPPSGCSIVPSQTTLPPGGGSITLTATCTGGDPPTSYAWTGPGVPPTTATPAVGTTITSTSTFTMTASNAAGASSPPAQVTVTVVQPISISPPSLQPAKANVQYSQAITASGGVAPYAFAVSSGALPAGLTLNPQTGVISGTPTTVVTATLTITVTDSASPANSASKTYTLGVAQPTGTPQGVSGNAQIVPASTAAQPLIARIVQIANGVTTPVAGAAVTWSQPAGQGGTISNPSQLSDANGIVQTGYTTGPGQQDNKVTVTVTLSGSSFTFTIRNQQTAVIVPAKQVIGPQAQVAVNTPTIQLNNIRQRLDQLRLAASPTATDGLRVSFDGRALPPISAFSTVPVDKDGKPQIGGGAAADQPDPFERWSGFINGDIDIARQSTVDTQTGFKVNSKGITVGADRRFTGNNVVGASVGFLHADTDLDAGAGTQNAKGYSFSLYGSYVPVENAYIDGIVNFGHNRYSSQRQSPTASFDSDTRGNQWGAAVSAGYAFNRGPLALTPYGRVEHIDAKVDGFSENGDPDNALMIGDQRIKATTLTVGGTASYAISTSWGVLLPNGHLEFQHLAQSNAKDVSAQIVSAVTSAPAQIRLLGQDKSFGNYSLGLSALFARGVGTFFNYQQLFGKSDVSDRLYTLGLRIEF